MNRCSSLLALSLLGLCSFVSLQSAKAISFAEFEGAYRGTGTLFMASEFGSSTTSGPARVLVEVSPDGQSADVTLKGSVTMLETNVPMFGDVSFKNGVFGVDNYTLRVDWLGKLPARGSYRGGRRNIAFTAVGRDSSRAPVSGSMSVRTKGNKRTIVFFQKVILTSGYFTFRYEATRRLRPSEL
jgi:hypothetical protein